MEKYALILGDLTLYFKRDSLRKEEEIVLKRSEVIVFSKKDVKPINKLFLGRGKSEKIRDRDVGNYQIKFKVGDDVGFRAPESLRDQYKAFSASII